MDELKYTAFDIPFYWSVQIFRDCEEQKKYLGSILGHLIKYWLQSTQTHRSVAQLFPIFHSRDGEMNEINP